MWTLSEFLTADQVAANSGNVTIVSVVLPKSDDQQDSMSAEIRSERELPVA
jgi:hypothetical protein